MTVQNYLSRGDYWFHLLASQGKAVSGLSTSIKVADIAINDHKIRYIAVVPDKNNPFPRARKGQVGLLEGWSLAKVINESIEADKEQDKNKKTAIIAIIDVASQAYGRREEAYGIHQALAGATAAYSNARLKGHPLVGLIVGSAMSGAFLAHGYQANRLIAFNDPKVMIHAMGKEAAARITLRTISELEKLAATIPPMAYDIEHYTTLGLLWQLMTLKNPDLATAQDVAQVTTSILQAITDIKQTTDLNNRLGAANRAASSMVRERMRQEW